MYKFRRMQLGLKNALSTFQRAVDIILPTVEWKFARVYLDDIVIFSRSVEENLEHMKTVLELSSRAGVSLWLKKYFFSGNELIISVTQ